MASRSDSDAGAWTTPIFLYGRSTSLAVTTFTRSGLVSERSREAPSPCET